MLTKAKDNTTVILLSLLPFLKCRISMYSSTIKLMILGKKAGYSHVHI